jgi:hypothetical protein
VSCGTPRRCGITTATSCLTCRWRTSVLAGVRGERQIRRLWVLRFAGTGSRWHGVTQADYVDHLIDPALADTVGLGQRQQMVAGRPAGVHRLGLQHDASSAIGADAAR